MGHGLGCDSAVLRGGQAAKDARSAPAADCTEHGASGWRSHRAREQSRMLGSSIFLREDVCCSAFVEVALQSEDTEDVATRFPRYSTVDLAPDTPERLRRCMESPYETPWAEEQPADYLCTNNFIQATACVAGLPDVQVIFDIFLGGGCTSMAAAHGSAGKVLPAEVFSFDLPEKLAKSLAPTGRLAQGDGTWWDITVVNETPPQPKLQEVLLRPGAGRMPRLVLVADYLEVVATASWNTLDVLCQHRQSLDFVVVDSSANVLFEKEWLIIETLCRPKRVLLTNLNLPSASSWIWHRLTRLNWQEIMWGHYLLDGDVWPPHSEMRRLRSWSLLSPPR
ncbi:unnamed protein product [Durusdinium trenchii]|uniref:Cyclin-dependent kinase 7 n=2 Tax=Durusdinium trenchii TaxID=1381693 RepID=A0ABP0I981_9DINO